MKDLKTPLDDNLESQKVNIDALAHNRDWLKKESPADDEPAEGINARRPQRRVVLQYNPDSRERAIFAKNGTMGGEKTLHTMRPQRGETAGHHASDGRRIELPRAEASGFHDSKSEEDSYTKEAKSLYVKLDPKHDTTDEWGHELETPQKLGKMRVSIVNSTSDAMSKDIKDHTGEDIAASTIKDFQVEWIKSVESTRAIYLQEAVARQFDITVPSLFDKRVESVLKSNSAKMIHDPVLEHQAELIAASQYRLTQQYYKDRGITHVTLYRGVYYNEGSDPFGIMGNGDRKKAMIESSPLSSWSISPKIADSFTWARDSNGYVMASSVPVERIFSSAITGHGSLIEGEHVVIGGDTPVDITRTYSPNGIVSQESYKDNSIAENDDWLDIPPVNIDAEAHNRDWLRERPSTNDKSAGGIDTYQPQRLILQYNPDSRERAIFAKSGEMHPSGSMHPWANTRGRDAFAERGLSRMLRGSIPRRDEIHAHIRRQRELGERGPLLDSRASPSRMAHERYPQGDPKKIEDYKKGILDSRKPSNDIGHKPFLGHNEERITALRAGKIDGQYENMSNGINGVYRAGMTHADGSSHSVVIKPERELVGSSMRDSIPVGEDWSREHGAQVVNEAMGHFVSMPAIVRRDAPGKGMSIVSDYVANNGSYYDFRGHRGGQFSRDEHNAAVFDAVIGNLDRHGENALITTHNGESRLVLIDHGLSFPDPAYGKDTFGSTILMDKHGGTRLFPEEQKALENLVMSQGDTESALIAGGLSPDAANSVFERANHILGTDRVPRRMSDLPFERL